MVQRLIIFFDRILFFAADRFQDHLSTDKNKQSECDPMIHALDIHAKTRAQKPPDHRHQRLKSAEIYADHNRLFPPDLLHAKSFTGRHSKRIHG